MKTDAESGDRYFDIHVFCCVNERPPGHHRGSCSARGSIALQEYMKARGKELKINQRIRTNKCGCLDRCELGPVMVIYPEGTWYHYRSREDIDEILDSHVTHGRLVERLLLRTEQKVLDPEVSARLELKVSRIDKHPHDIRRYELMRDDGDDLPAFEPGAHIDLFTGDGLRRSYSLAGDPAVRDRYVLGIRREQPSRGGSDWLLDHLSVGDDVVASLPSNNFPLNETAARHTLIAGGIGVTPVMAMGYQLRRQGMDCHLHFCAPDEARAPLLEEVQSIFGDNLTLHFDNGDPAQGIDLDRLLENPSEGEHVYVCGPAGLVGSVREKAAHWPAGTVHWEPFTPETDQAPQKNEVFEVVLSRRNVRLEVPIDKTILEVVREAGVDIESSCEDGLCGCCRVGLLGGVPDHRDLVLTDAEKASSADIMTCVSRAKAGEVLVLDI